MCCRLDLNHAAFHSCHPPFHPPIRRTTRPTKAEQARRRAGQVRGRSSIRLPSMRPSDPWVAAAPAGPRQRAMCEKACRETSALDMCLYPMYHNTYTNNITSTSGGDDFYWGAWARSPSITPWCSENCRSLSRLASYYAKACRRCAEVGQLGIHQRGVQSEGGVVDWGSTI